MRRDAGNRRGELAIRSSSRSVTSSAADTAVPCTPSRNVSTSPCHSAPVSAPPRSAAVKASARRVSLDRCCPGLAARGASTPRAAPWWLNAIAARTGPRLIAPRRGAMLPYDRLFPPTGDYDPQVRRWSLRLGLAISIAPTPLCDLPRNRRHSLRPQYSGCAEHRPTPGSNSDPATRARTPRSPSAARLFEPLWAKHRAELIRRHHEVQSGHRRRTRPRAAKRLARTILDATLPVPAVRHPGGKKFKRCHGAARPRDCCRSANRRRAIAGLPPKPVAHQHVSRRGDTV